MNLLLAAVIAGASYVLGSIPAGYIAGRIAGTDVRKCGSGNIGATNVVRVLGKRYGYAVFLFDMLKGLIAVRFAYFAVARNAQHTAIVHPEYYAIVAAVMAIVGHSFPVWLAFRGGKGVATSIGVILGLVPIAALIVLVVWYLAFEITRYVSVASVVAAAALPLIIGALMHFGLTSGVALVYFAFLVALLVVWRHRSNLGRLRAGTEPRFERK